MNDVSLWVHDHNTVEVLAVLPLALLGVAVIVIPALYVFGFAVDLAGEMTLDITSAMRKALTRVHFSFQDFAYVTLGLLLTLSAAWVLTLLR